MSEQAPIITLRQDQIFGLYANLPDELAHDLACYLDECRFPYARSFTPAARLDREGLTTLLFPGSLKDLTVQLREYGATVVPPPPDGPESPRYRPPFSLLLERGELESSDDASPALPSFESADVPGLIAMLEDEELHNAPSFATAVWAPLHAMRALGNLRAEAAITPLLAQLKRIDTAEDHYVGPEVAEALAAIGASALAPTAAYLHDSTHGEYARLAAAEALTVLASKIPECRTACVEAVTLQLMSHRVQNGGFNGLLVSRLIDMQAIESIALIERVYAEGPIDDFVCGDWEDVQIEFGLKQKREHPPKPNKFTEMGRQLRQAFGLPEIDPMAEPAMAAPVPPPQPRLRAAPKVGRNDPCPCGSGKKFKKCCGA